MPLRASCSLLVLVLRTGAGAACLAPAQPQHAELALVRSKKPRSLFLETVPFSIEHNRARHNVRIMLKDKQPFLRNRSLEDMALGLERDHRLDVISHDPR